ncbi:mycothiol conjugate amidase Mca [Virgisporangium ochraceum]
MGEQLRLMAVHAHPDDESSKGAATMARYVAEGVDVLVVTCTGGERGSVLNPKLDRPEIWEQLPELRRAEMDRAREILGIRQEWLGFVDSGYPEGEPLPPLTGDAFALVPVEEAAAPLVRLIRSFRPHVVLTYDEDGGYPHPDHVMTHKISMVAFDAAGDPERYPGEGPVWQPLKLYYHMWNMRRIETLHNALLAEGLESPYGEWLKNLDPKRDKSSRVTTRVECGEYFEQRDDALRAHATQVDPDGQWFAVPRDMQVKHWPTEDYELVRSMVDSPTPEDDLFAGVRERVSA